MSSSFNNTQQQTLEANHKVVIVLDRSPKFAANAPLSEASVPSRDDPNASTTKPIKSLWNYATETALEFHRVVSDIFPQSHKQLRFVISDYVGKFLTPPWSDHLISQKELSDALNNCEAPKADGDASSCSILNGILFALDAISERTPLQKEALRHHRFYLDRKEQERLKLFSRYSDNVLEASNKFREREKKNRGEEEFSGSKKRGRFHGQNKGAILVITTLNTAEDFESMNEYFAEQISARNDSNKTSMNETMLHIDHVDFFIINIISQNNMVMLPGNDHPISEKKHSLFQSRLFSLLAGPNLTSGVHRILQDIYSLVSTTVVGIPMKEANQSGQSSMHYDVELLHPRGAHSALNSSGLLDEQSSKLRDSPSIHWQLFTSVRLKWCTSKALKNEIPSLLRNHFYPFTLAQVKNRASVCLTTFIGSGKSVMLEVLPEAYRREKEQEAPLPPPPPTSSSFSSSSSPSQSLLGPNVKDKLISHYLSKSASDQLVMQCVVFGGKDGSSKKSDLSSSSSFPSQLFAETSSPSLSRNTQKQPSQLEETTKSGVPTRLFTGAPANLRDSFIYNVPEKFEPLLTLVHQPELSSGQFDQCRTQICWFLVAYKGSEPLTNKFFECALLPAGVTSATASKEEQFRVAFDELYRVLQKVSAQSASHKRLFELFAENSGGMRRTNETTTATTTKIAGLANDGKRKNPLQKDEEHQQLEKKRKEEGEKEDEEEKEKEELQRAAKRRKTQIAACAPGEELINLYEWWHARYETEFWSSWKGDFEGRKKYGDKAQEFLYPSLKLPPGQSKAAGTGTAGPIE